MHILKAFILCTDHLFFTVSSGILSVNPHHLWRFVVYLEPSISPTIVFADPLRVPLVRHSRGNFRSGIFCFTTDVVSMMKIGLLFSINDARHEICLLTSDE